MNLWPVLLVEDQPDDQFLTLRTLKKLKINNVDVANEGEEALRYLRDRVVPGTTQSSLLPELIILDLRMPKVDGFQFLELVNADDRIKEIPVIVLSSSPQESDKARCRELGVKAYLKKPLEIDAFDRALKKVQLA
ncbi:response regulator [Geobacter pelophilus]|uniref:Response regulator n=1 Tax=Geoanaerobacter pelophilus TaxID=60036 RepID=A0AAW4L6P2_9BACT|nr:response regulator [Geoanaerobacter pelophilus]MBT0662921.1 response regulator [Geoanaerobacter pelophilus]